MREIKSDNQKALDRTLKEIDSWGILTLMAHMKSYVMQDFDKQRSSIVKFHLVGYGDTSLSNLDQVRDAFEAVYDREFKKVYNQKEQEYYERN